MPVSGFVAVGVGAALGAWLRWWLGVAFNTFVPALPLGTLIANLLGGYLVGAAVEFSVQHSALAAELRLFVITGFLGGLTTFSTFSVEAVALLSGQQYGWIAAHVGSHLAGSIVMTVLGIATVKAFHG